MPFAVRKVTAEKGSFVGHPIHSSTGQPMPTKRCLTLAVFLVFLMGAVAFAADVPPSYVELADAPTITVDWNNGYTQVVTLGGDRTLVFKNGQKGGKYLLVLKQDAHGSRTVTLPFSVRWPGLTPPVNPPLLTTTANKTDYINFFYNGVTYDVFGLTRNY